jgi:hypothetical protein
MTAPASLLAEVVDALYAVFSTGLPDVTVYDGPQPQNSSSKAFVLVGSTELAGEGTDGELSQSDMARSALGNGEFLEETGFVTCTAVAWSGATRAAPPRRQALELVDQCRALLAADPTLSVLPAGYYAEVGSIRLLQEQAPSGYRAKATFSVTYSALLTP